MVLLLLVIFCIPWENWKGDVAVVVGDFNVDFDRDDFIIELDLSVCDVSFHDKVKFTYERDDGACRSCTFFALSLTLPLLLMSRSTL